MEREWLERELAAGRSIEAIAREVRRDPSTVAYWVNKHGLTSQHAPKHAARGGIAEDHLRELVERGLSVRQIAAECAVSPTAVRYWLRRFLVAEAGGRCVNCGYDRYPGALQFHHLDPAQKRLEFAGRGITRALSILREEARKCVLLCANCHAEVEAGFAVLAAPTDIPG